MDNKQRELNKQILDRIASDSRFREELLDDPRGAMSRAGFTWDGSAGDDVSGYLFNFPAPGSGGKKGGHPASTAITCVDPSPGPVNETDPFTGGKGGGNPGSTAITCVGGGETDPPPMTTT
jgi:hypothetical protein